MCDSTRLANAERQVRIRHVVDGCIDRRAAGDEVTDESLIAAHPDLMPELEAALRDLRLVERAQMAVEQALPDGLHIRCPHCRNPIEIVEDSSLSDLVCTSCGSTFQLTDDSDRTFRAGREEMVNHFQLLERVGVGAFGSVWSACDTQLDRTVALKIPRKGQMGLEDQELFIREARAAAQLKHPSIVRVLEVGRYKDRIYIACDFIEGVDLADWLTDQQTTSREAAELCATVADALEHAHKHGVIHRDLKPSNIMLDRSGEPHLMDFGLAKREAAEITMTLEGKLVGTPAYMSPEQARGAAHEADARSDVYSLGVILFELLTGERPFRGSTRMLLHQVLVEDAPSPRKLNPSVPRDMETICLKCLDKDPSRRYQSAGVLRDDLRRFLDGHPVHARPITRSARAWRWTKRNPVVSGLVAAIACLLLFLAIGSVAVAIKQQRLATAAKKSEIESQRRLAQQFIQRGRTACDSGFVAQGLHWFARSLDVIPAEDTALRSSTTENLKAWSRFPVTPTAVFHQIKVTAIGYSPDETTMVTFGPEVKLWSAQTGELIHDLRGEDTGFLFYFDFSADGRRLLASGHGPTATLWSVETGRTLATLDHEDVENVNGVAFSQGGDFLVTAASNGLRRWSGETFELVSRTEIDQNSSEPATFSSDGSLLLTAGDDGQTTIWNVETNQMVGKPMKRGSRAQFSLDNRLLVTTFEDKVHVWSTDDGQPLWEREHYGLIKSVSFGTKGEFVLTASVDGAARVWSAQDGMPQTDPLQHRCPVLAAAFHPRGESFVTVDQLAFIRHWSTRTGELLTRPARFDPFSDYAQTNVAFRQDGQRLMVGPFVSAAFELDTSDLQPFAPLLRLSKPDGWGGFCVAINHNGTRAVTGGWRGQLGLWSLETGKPLGELLGYERIWGISHSPTGPYFIATTGYIGDTTQKRAFKATEDQLVEVATLAGAGGAVAFSPDGDLVVTGASDSTARFWSTTTWTEIRDPLPLPEKLSEAAFFPDGDLVAFFCSDGIVHFWSRATEQFDGPTLRHPEARGSAVHAPQARPIAVSPDGGQVATGGMDRRVIIWESATRKPTGIALAHDGPVMRIAYTPDGKRLLTATKGGSVYMWAVDTGERIGPPSIEPDYAKDVAFGPNRNHVLVGTAEGAELWGVDLSPAAAIDDPDVWVRAITGREMNSSGVLEWLDRPTWLEDQRRASKH